MFDSIETLIALRKNKTMLKTATNLRVTQSAISKRVKSLENIVGKKLIVQNGRNVDLTKDAIKFLDLAIPHIRGIKEAINQSAEIEESIIRIGFSESIISSWGSQTLAKTSQKINKHFSLIPHVHRGPMVIDRVMSGDYQLGLCAGNAKNRPGILKIEIGKERMVLIKSKGTKRLPLMSIEPTSETWTSIRDDSLSQGIVPDQWIEFFSPIVSLASEGVVEGFVPIGIAKSIKSIKKNIILKKTEIFRPITLITQKSFYHRSEFEDLFRQIKKHAQQELDKINR